MTYEHQKAYRSRNPERRNSDRAANYAVSRSLATRGTTRWSSEEVKTLREWDGTDRELGAQLGRSVQAIQTKRSRL